VQVGKHLRVRWRANHLAAYYNVQLYRGRRKVLSLFPVASSTVIKARYLRPGSYRLIVWSGLGAKALARYQRAPWIDVALRVRRLPARIAPR
jgi:hypothetical protein